MIGKHDVIPQAGRRTLLQLIYYYRTNWSVEGSVFGALSLCFLFVFETSL